MLRADDRDQVGRQGADRRVVEADHEVLVAGGLSLVVEVVASLEDRPQAGRPAGSQAETEGAAR